MAVFKGLMVPRHQLGLVGFWLTLHNTVCHVSWVVSSISGRELGLTTSELGPLVVLRNVAGGHRAWLAISVGNASFSFLFVRYLYHVLTKNTTVTEQNRNLLVETIRSITEILIWGDQNDSSVFE